MCVPWLPSERAVAQPAEDVTTSNEYTVKAVFLYSFGRYTDWPKKTFTKPSKPFVIGVVGESSLGRPLREIALQKRIHDRRIVVRQFASPDALKQPCQILFISRAVPLDQQKALLKKMQGAATLVVGETPGFAEMGGAVNFFDEDERIQFEINIEAVRRAQLRMDAQLLNLGRPVSPRAATVSE